MDTPRFRRLLVLLTALAVPFFATTSSDARGEGLRTASRAPLRLALRDIYPPPAQANPDVAAALQRAAATHRRVIIDFGGNWCPDCHVLDLFFHDGTNSPILDAGFVLVHVNIGRLNENVELAERYHVPLNKGVPALAVLDSDGSLLYSQQNGEFEAMRHLQSNAVTDFLRHWQPAALP